MSHPGGNIANFDGDVDMLVTRILTNWEYWSFKKSSEGCQESSHCPSHELSFESMRSSPELAANAAASPNFQYSQQEHCATSGASQRPSKPKMPTKRRMKASEREKMRMRSLADALHQLRDYLPPDYRSLYKTKAHKAKPGWNEYVGKLHAEARKAYKMNLDNEQMTEHIGKIPIPAEDEISHRKARGRELIGHSQVSQVGHGGRGGRGMIIKEYGPRGRWRGRGRNGVMNGFGPGR